MIKSPTYGTVEKVNPKSVLIYIAVEDPHGVYAPISGKIKSLKSEDGIFLSPPPFWKTDWTKQTGISDASNLSLFTVEPPKTERLWIEIESKTISVSFYVEVGRPQYITNNVSLYVKVGDNVQTGDHLGDILIGSRAKIYTPKSWKIVVKLGQKLEGGKTTVFEKTKDNLMVF